MTTIEFVAFVAGIVGMIAGILLCYEGFQLGASLLRWQSEPDAETLRGLKIVGVLAVLIGGMTVCLSIP